MGRLQIVTNLSDRQILDVKWDDIMKFRVCDLFSAPECEKF